MTAPSPSNEEIATVLERISSLLETQGADPFRVRAYRSAANTVRRHPESVAALAEDLEALDRLPNIGTSIGRTIAQFVRTGHARILDKLEGQVSPEDQFTRVPGIGEVLAREIHQKLKVETLEELEAAAHDGRLARLHGMGPRRVLAVRNALDNLLRSRRLHKHTTPPAAIHEPTVAALLDIDALYRRKADARELHLIAPKRFNPERKAWLPIMHAEEEGWHFTALFSNTERAHSLGKTLDWVVLIYERDGEHGQSTVISEPRGPLKGKRVVRGREEESMAFYEQRSGARCAPPEARGGKRATTSTVE
jgi:D-alanyl-D-alanine dipeptidase